MAGRKTKLTPEVQKKIVEYIRGGAYKAHAAEAAGVSVDAVDNWIRRGEDSDEEPYTEFAAAMRQAQGEDAVRDVQVISRAATDGDWKAAAWKLERKYPAEFGQRQHIDQSIAVGGEFSDWSDEELKQFTLTGKRPKR